jgi:chaperone BCS1
MHNREWYADLGIPYTLGIGLHGPPGTGKTSLVKCIANYTGRHIIVLSLKLIKTRKQLFEFFYEQKYNINNTTPISFENKIILLEDLDCCTNIVLQRRSKNTVCSSIAMDMEGQYQHSFDDTKKTKTILVNPDEPITLDDILNLWDGIRETPGRIMIITSNHYNKLDPALVRPGRIDITLELKNADRTIIGDMYKHLFRKTIPLRVLSKIPDYKYSPASIMNKYISCKNNSELFTRSLLDDST